MAYVNAAAAAAVAVVVRWPAQCKLDSVTTMALTLTKTTRTFRAVVGSCQLTLVALLLVAAMVLLAIAGGIIGPTRR